MGMVTNRIFKNNLSQAGACHQLKDFVAKMAGFENRIAEYIQTYLRNGSAENRHLQSKSQ
jgi:hypothetical protein